jgi:2-oxo-4-hydroxy-4-carboxy-5-ureidoimidazoline decarboxylase
VTDVPTFDRMPASEAAGLLRACCGSTRWVDGMLARRPFGALGALLSAADHVWLSLGPADWRAAFDHHPRLGDTQSATPADERARAWSSNEQAGLSDAADDARAMLAAANAAYEARFGYLCIICATGLDVGDVLALTEERLANAPADELPIAVEEQRKITRLRLLKLFHDPTKATPR